MGKEKWKDQIQFLENQKIRAAWDSEQAEWYFSAAGALTDQSSSRGTSTYWQC